jgi:signal transduction histidine kinase
MTSSLPLAATQDYPLLNLFWTMLWLFLWILWIFLLVRILLDVFRSDDLNGLSKALWTIFIIVLPFLGVLVYLIARGSSMHLRETRQVQANQQAADTYIRSVAGTSASTADELSKLARLRDDGTLTAAEFDAQKARLLS